MSEYYSAIIASAVSLEITSEKRLVLLGLKIGSIWPLPFISSCLKDVFGLLIRYSTIFYFTTNMKKIFREKIIDIRNIYIVSYNTKFTFLLLFRCMSFDMLF